jgi:hypothetical protein
MSIIEIIADPADAGFMIVSESGGGGGGGR